MSGPRQIGQYGMTAFVPNGTGGYSRKDLAILLIGAAREGGLDSRRAVRATSGGFFISDELADLLYAEQEEDEVSGNAEAKAPKKSTRKRSSKKASGNRAAKNSTSEQE